MNAQELREAFLVAYDIKANFAAPGYEDSEISQFLSTAQDEVVDGFIKAGQFEMLKELYTMDTMKLSPCTLEYLGECAYQSDGATNSEFLTYISSFVYVTARQYIMTITNRWVQAQLTARTSIQNFIQQPSNQPVVLYPKVLLHYENDPDRGNNVIPIVLIDKYTTIAVSPDTGLNFTYIRRASRVNITNSITCEIHPRLHQLVVNLAAQTAIATSDASRTQQQSQAQPRQQQQSEEE